MFLWGHTIPIRKIFLHGKGRVLRLRMSLLLPLLLLFALSTGVWAQMKGNGVSVRIVTATQITASPGQIVSLSFLVTSESAQEDDFIESLTLPPQWQSVIAPGSFSLPPTENTVRLSALQVPSSSPAGRYQISYSVHSRRDPGIRDVEDVIIMVLPIAKLALLLEEKPDVVVAGQRCQLIIRVINQGNAAVDAAITVKSDRGSDQLQLGSPHVVLPAGDNQLIAVNVQTDSRESRAQTHNIQLQVMALDDKMAKYGASLSVGLEVLPRANGKTDMYHTLPSELTLRLPGEGANSALQAVWQGAGTLDEEGERRFSFLFQGPDTQGHGSFGMRDEYRMRLATKEFDMRLGDQNDSLSSLTDYYRSGQGLGIDLHTSAKNTLGAYFLQNRWDTTSPQTNAVYLRHTFNDSFGVKLNFVEKSQTLSGDTTSTLDQLTSVEAHLHPQPDMNIQLEYGGSSTTRPHIGEDHAYRVELDGKFGHAGNYNIRKIYAGPDYQGYYRDTDYLSGNVTLPFTQRLQGTFSYSSCLQNLDLRSDRRTALDEHLAQAGLHFSPVAGWFFNVSLEEFHCVDLLAPEQTQYTEHPIRWGVGQTLGNLSWSGEYRQGKREDLAHRRISTTDDYRFFASYRPNAEQFFTLYGGYGNADQVGGQVLLGANRFLGASATLKPLSALSLTGWYTHNDNTGDRQQSGQADISARYELSGGAAMTLHVLHTTQDSGQANTAYVLAYSIPLEIPVSKKKHIGVIKGRIYDAKQPAHLGINNVLLTLNGTVAVTDEQGCFIFPAFPEGEYTLNVDRKSIGLNHVTELGMPMMVKVSSGLTTALNIGVIDGITLTGKVLVFRQDPHRLVQGNTTANTLQGADGLYVVGDPLHESNDEQANTVKLNKDSYTAPAESNAPKDVYGLGNVLVELTDGNEVIRRVSDYHGDFLFENLRPGKWHMKVYDYNLPAYHYLEQPALDMELGAHTQESVECRVLPKLRKIIMVAEPSAAQNAATLER